MRLRRCWPVAGCMVVLWMLFGQSPVVRSLAADEPSDQVADHVADEDQDQNSADRRPRLLVLTDIGGDPDDTQSLVRLMVYANKFRIEGLIASASGTPGELKEKITRPDLILEIVNAYERVLPNLKRHERGWPEAKTLRLKVKSGNAQRGREHIGAAHDTEGSRFLVQCVDRASRQDPLNIAIWGGQTDLAQALWRVREDRGQAGLSVFISKFRVYDIADQDRIADWMREEFEGMFYILSKAPGGRDKRLATFRGMYLTGDESLTSRAWIQKNILAKGPLGSLYPTKTWTAPNPHSCMKEGDTPSWFFFLPDGGNQPNDPTKPGWGGRFSKQADGWYRDLGVADGETSDSDATKSTQTDPRTTVSRWRGEFQADFARRMQWCVESD